MRPNPKGGFHYICDLPAGSHKQVDEKKTILLEFFSSEVALVLRHLPTDF